MSTTTQAIELIDDLVKAKIPKQTATALVDYAGRQRDKNIDRLWIAMGILAAVTFTGFAALLTIMLYLHSDTKAAIKEYKTDTQRSFDEVKNLIRQIK